MAKTIVQKIKFRSTTAADIYQLYMDEKTHSVSTGSKAKIIHKVGTSFSAYDGYISGTILQLIDNHLIVQSWRASDWSDSDVDSTFILNIVQSKNDVVLYVVHANLPDNHAAEISKGWHDFYWKPWKIYLKA